MAQIKDFVCGFFIKMKEKTINNPIKIEPLPFFKKGSLMYEKSGHVLELSDGYYRCSEHCKSDTGEKQIKAENLEKNFSYYVQKFRLEQKDAGKISDELMKKYLIDLLTEPDIEGKQEVLDTTIRAMDEDLKNIKSVKA